MLTVPRIKEAIAEVAPQFSISRVDLFGSYASGRATEKSDVDVLIEKTPSFSLFDMCQFGSLLEEKLGLPVDVVINTPKTLNGLVIDTRVTLYER